MAEEPINRALDSIEHRGPDGRGLFRRNEVFMGMTRLAIIDQVGGQQPIYNEDGSIVVILNGEIYNYVELVAELESLGHIFKTRSDTEVLVHLYEEFRNQMFSRLRGMFAFALWDFRSRRLILARDRFGKKPLYYSWNDKLGLLFASELKALKILGKSQLRSFSISNQSISDYLSLAAVPQPNTVYKEARMLPPATEMVCSLDGCSERKYWDFPVQEKLQLSYSELLDRTRNEIREAVRLRLRSDVPVGLFLSAGIDSSIVAYEAAQTTTKQLITFTVRVDDPELDESKVAEKTAKSLNMEHHTLDLAIDPVDCVCFLVKHFDQPFADPSAIPSLAVSRLAGQHVKVVLNGDGGDELFGGYRRHFAAARAESFEWFPKSFCSVISSALGGMSSNRRSIVGLTARFFRGLEATTPSRYLLWSTNMLEQCDKNRWWCQESLRPTEELISDLWPVGKSSLRSQLLADIRINLLSVLLVKMDMASMASSIEARSPFLDHELAEFSQRIPDSLLLSRRKTKSILRDAYAGRLSRDVLLGGKKGFEIPLERWLQEDLRELVHDSLGNSQALIHSYLDQSLLKGLLEGTLLRDRNHPFILYSLLVLELWLQGERST